MLINYLKIVLSSKPAKLHYLSQTQTHIFQFVSSHIATMQVWSSQEWLRDWINLNILSEDSLFSPFDNSADDPDFLSIFLFCFIDEVFG